MRISDWSSDVCSSDLVSIELLLWPCVLYLLLHVWGLHEAGEKLLRTLFSRGFTLGSTRIVIGKLLFGIVLFGVLFMFTRWLKRKLETDWLVRANVEPGTREAAATLRSEEHTSELQS